MYSSKYTKNELGVCIEGLTVAELHMWMGGLEVEILHVLLMNQAYADT
jgi:hypothetical protein